MQKDTSPRALDLRRHIPAVVKRGLRSSADHAARMSGFLARHERNAARHLTVLMYHRVLPEERCARYLFPALVMPRSAFREQVRWLAAHGDVLPLAEALAQSGEHAQRPVFALTFDDGYDDSSEIVAEVLDDVGVRGTFFVTTGFVGTSELLWFDRAALLFAELAEPARRAIVQQVCGERDSDDCPRPGSDVATWTGHLKSCSTEARAAVLSALELATGGPPASDGYRSLSIAQLVEMHGRGHEIGSHTVSHAMLPELDDASLRNELHDARDAISSWTGGDVPGFCYPNGDHDERTVAAVARAGHVYSCTTREGLHPRGGDAFRIRRVGIDPRRVLSGSLRLDVTAFRRELCGQYRRYG